MSPSRSPRLAALANSQDDSGAPLHPRQQITPTPRLRQARQTAGGRRGRLVRRSPPAPRDQETVPRDGGVRSDQGVVTDQAARPHDQAQRGEQRSEGDQGHTGPRSFIAPVSRDQAIFQFPELPANDDTAGEILVSNPDVASLPLGGKPSTKNITIELLSGFVAPGSFDSGVRRWWRKFLDQLSDAQILDGHRWSDIQCRSIFVASLTGLAADWYSELRLIQSDLTLLRAGSLLVEKYKSKLPEQEPMSRIMLEPKRRQETYQEYAQRLLSMADFLPGGLAAEGNARQALHTFIKRGYYKYSDELKSYVGRLAASVPAAQKLQLLVDHLSYMADSDGRLPAKPTSHPVGTGSFKRLKVEPGTAAVKSGNAAAMLVEHKHKKAHSRNRPRHQESASYKNQKDIRCFNCNQTGHFARDCPDKKGRDQTSARLQGSAASALNEDRA